MNINDVIKALKKYDGEEITLKFCDFLRDDRKFSSVDELKAQLKSDLKNIER